MQIRPMLISALLTATSFPALAETYYVAPQGASIACPSDGSLGCPWKSVDAAFGSGKIAGNDTILLMDGKHGELKINHQMFDKVVTIQSQNEKGAHINAAHFGDDTKNIRLKDIKIWRPEGSWAGYMIRSYSGSSYLTFEDLDIRSRKDSANYLEWSQARWIDVASNSVDLRGRYNVVRDSRITGVGRGIIASGNSLVENNVVDGFVWDGLRGVSNSVFRNNLVMNSLKVDSVHRDGFQSYASGDVVGLTVEGNTFLSWTHENPDHALRGDFQGISLFDGFYDDLVIRNNVVATRHSNGIAIKGTRRATIVNNTVVDMDGLPKDTPWIRVSNHKDGRPSKDVLVANNIAMRFLGSSHAENNIVYTDNSVIYYPARVLEDVGAFNYRPKIDSGFIDNGNSLFAPSTDIENAPRPFGAGPDRGAYEVGAVSDASTDVPEPSDADTGVLTGGDTSSTTDTSTTTDVSQPSGADTNVITDDGTSQTTKTVGKWMTSPNKNTSKTRVKKGQKWLKEF